MNTAQNAMPQDTTPVINEKVKTSSNKFIYVVSILLAFIILSGVGAYFLWAKSPNNIIKNEVVNMPSITKSTDSEGIISTIQNWVKPVSNTEAYIFIALSSEGKGSIPYILYPKTGESKSLTNSLDASWGSSASGFGEGYPFTSPDLKYSAYISKADFTLKLLNHEDLSSTALTNYPITYISGWMKDSNRIIYYIGENDIDSNSEMGPDYMGSAPTMVDFSKNTKPGGFYSFDISTGTETYLYPLNRMEAVVDNNRVITYSQAINSYVVFDIDKFTADYASLSGIPGYNNELAFGQLDFTKNGSKWVYSYSANPTDDGSIILADFPSNPKTKPVGSKSLAEGLWADFNFPRWVNEDQHVVYIKRGSGVNRSDKLSVYDLKTGQTKDYLQNVSYYNTLGRSSKVLVETMYGENSNSRDFILFDVVTGEAKTILQTEYKN